MARLPCVKLLSAAALAAGILLHPARGLADETLSLCYIAGNSIYWDLDTAIDKGFFKAEGFTPQTVGYMSSSNAVQELVGGSVDLVGGMPDTMVDAFDRGGTDLGIIAAPARGVDWTLNSQRSIKTIAGLKGKTIGLALMKGGEMVLTRQVLAKAHMKPSDVNIIQVGVSPLKLAALQKGSIDATVLFQPSGVIAEDKGFPVLFDYTTIKSYPAPDYMARRSWAAKSRNGIRLGQAIVKAQQWLLKPANHDEALTIIEKYTKVSPAIAAKIYKLYFGRAGFIPGDGKLDLAGFKRFLVIRQGDGDLKGSTDPKRYVIPAADGGLFK